MTMPVIAAQNVGVSYKDASGRKVQIADHLSFSLTSGTSLCLVGRSGSGKTSILRVLAGLAYPQAGNVYWWGSKLSEMGEEEIRGVRRSRLGYVDQSSVLVNDLTAFENVMLPAIPRPRSERRAMDERARGLLSRLGVLDRSRHLPSTLSGGERQRVALARALLTSPELLIVDEPTASLDSFWADIVVSVLKECQSGGSVVITASHDPVVVASADYGVRVENLQSLTQTPSATVQ